MRRTPRLEVDLHKVFRNAKLLVDLFKPHDISVMGIVKSMLGEPRVGRVLVEAGVNRIGDSRLENLRRLRQAGVAATLCYIRPAAAFELDDLLECADVSFHSEPAILSRLSDLCRTREIPHRAILSLDIGGVREGLAPGEAAAIATRSQRCSWLTVEGVATQFGCPVIAPPTSAQLDAFQRAASVVQQAMGQPLSVVSIGGSICVRALLHDRAPRAINDVRIGEALFLGTDGTGQPPSATLAQDAVALVAEVISLKPDGIGILNVGTSDLGAHATLNRSDGCRLSSASGDLMLIERASRPLRLGEQVRLTLTYASVIAATASPHVEKIFSESVAA